MYLRKTAHREPPEERQSVQRHITEFEGTADEGISTVIAPQLQAPLMADVDDGAFTEDIEGMLWIDCARNVANLYG